MTVTTATYRNLTITFVHSTHNAGQSDYKLNPKAGALRVALDLDAALSQRRLTFCSLSEETESGEHYRTLGEGVAICHPNDQFSKSVGRKTALSAAMKAAGLTLEDRRDVWNQYLLDFPPDSAKAEVKLLTDGNVNDFLQMLVRGLPNITRN